MTRWMETPGEAVFCPLCRAPWSPLVRQSYHHFSPSPYPGPSHLATNRHRLTSLSQHSTISRTSDTVYMVEGKMVCWNGDSNKLAVVTKDYGKKGEIDKVVIFNT